MERIQQALEKARATRTAGEQATDAPPQDRAPGSPAPASPAPAADAVADRWRSLRDGRPDPRALERGHVVAATGDRESGHFDVMRTKLLHQMRANGWRRIAVTSPGPACGKTTVSLNLAFSLARQPELRVVLADADLRRPSVARVLRQRPAAGLADLLEGRAGPQDVALRMAPNLAVVMNPGPRRNPVEIFNAPGCAPALAALEEALDPTVTIFDMPPTLVGDDVLAFAEHVDCALIIAAAGSTTIAEIDACEREIAARTNVVGVVVNRCRYMAKDYGYGD